MTRPARVTASAVVAIIGSVFTLVFAGFIVASAFVEGVQKPPHYGLIAFVMTAVFIALAGLGIWTAVGLFRMRGWARVSILVFAGIMAAMGLLMGVMMSVLPLPPTPNAPAGAVAKFRWVMVAIYAVPFLIGVWWLVLFNRQSTREAFTATAVPGEVSRRPLSVSIIGWWNLASGVFSLIPAAIRLPAFVAGVILTEWSATLFYVVFGALGLYLGWGLLKLDERARVVTIAWFAVTIAHSAYIALAPGPRERMREFERGLRMEGTLQPAPFDTTTFSTSMMLFAIPVLAVAIWFLVRNKAAFRHDGESAAPAPSA
jgi:hypothetical protein